MLQIIKDPIGRGKQRACYVHPDDPRKAIKISSGEINTHSRREIKFYRKLQKRGGVDEKHIPKFYGLCETNLGQGIVVDLIRNYDGEVSRPLDELIHSFLHNLIIFNHDLTIGNLLVQKFSTRKTRLVAIDGLGDVTPLGWLGFSPLLVRRKIRRRWARFMARVYRTREVRLQREAVDTESASGNQL
jgi:hypothetical protein